jgi:hypothetical protein
MTCRICGFLGGDYKEFRILEHFLPSGLFYPEDGSDMFLRNVFFITRHIRIHIPENT